MTPDEFLAKKKEFARQLVASTKCVHVMGQDIPILNEDQQQFFDGQYIYHTAWAARKLARIRPERHIDIGSSLFFVGIASAFVPVTHYDYRPPRIEIDDNLTVSHADITALGFPNDSVKSLSCLHVIEHIGLGRYGDPIDPEGDQKAIEELKRVLAPGGDLLIAVPLGWPQIFFNAHRHYDPAQIESFFLPLKKIDYYTAWQCGCFHFRKGGG